MNVQPNPAAVNVPAGQNLAQALNDHDRAKRLTDIHSTMANPAETPSPLDFSSSVLPTLVPSLAGIMHASFWSSKCVSGLRPLDGSKALLRTELTPTTGTPTRPNF